MKSDDCIDDENNEKITQSNISHFNYPTISSFNDNESKITMNYDLNAPYKDFEEEKKSLIINNNASDKGISIKQALTNMRRASVKVSENSNVLNTNENQVKQNSTPQNKKPAYEKKTFLYNKVNNTSKPIQRKTKFVDDKLGVNDILFQPNNFLNEDIDGNDFTCEQNKIEQEIKNLKMNSKISKLTTPNKQEIDNKFSTNNKTNFSTSRGKCNINIGDKSQTLSSKYKTASKIGIKSINSSHKYQPQLTNRSNNTISKIDKSTISNRSINNSKVKDKINSNVYFKKVANISSKTATSNKIAQSTNFNRETSIKSSRLNTNTNINNKSSNLNSIKTSEFKIRNITDSEEYLTILDEIQNIFSDDLQNFDEKCKYIS